MREVQEVEQMVQVVSHNQDNKFFKLDSSKNRFKMENHM